MKKLIITGNVGADPVFRTNQAGAEFACFPVAISAGTRDKPKTDWVDVVCNGRQCEITKEFVKKGVRLYLEGRNEVKAYIKDGIAMPSEQLIASTLEIQKFADRTDNTQPEGEVTASADSNTAIN